MKHLLYLAASILFLFPHVLSAQTPSITNTPTATDLQNIAAKYGLKIVTNLDVVKIEKTDFLTPTTDQDAGTSNSDDASHENDDTYYYSGRKYRLSISSYFTENGEFISSDAAFYKKSKELWSFSDSDISPDDNRPVFFEDSENVLIPTKIGYKMVGPDGKVIFYCGRNVCFSKNRQLICFDAGNVIGIFDLKSGSKKSINVEKGSQLITMQEDGKFVLVYNPKTKTYQRFDDNGVRIWERRLAESNYLIGFVSLANDSKIIVFDDFKNKQIIYCDAVSGLMVLNIPYPVRKTEKGSLEMNTAYVSSDGNVVLASAVFKNDSGFILGVPLIMAFNIAGDVIWQEPMTQEGTTFPSLSQLIDPNRFVVSGLSKVEYSYKELY